MSPWWFLAGLGVAGLIGAGVVVWAVLRAAETMGR